MTGGGVTPFEAEREGQRPSVTVLVTVTERPTSLLDLYHGYAGTLDAAGWAYEFVFALEPWHEPLAAPLAEARSEGHPIQVIQFAQPTGEATLLRAAAARADGDILLTVPAYWRIDPSSIPDLLERVRAGSDLVLGVRRRSADSWLNRLQSRLFHRMLHAASGSAHRDLACGVRAVRPEVLEEVPLYGDFLRFYPLLVAQAGFTVEEVVADQHSADEKGRVYAPGVYVRRLLDLLAVFFLLRFTDKPLRFFGLLGGGVAGVGAIILAVLLVQRLQGVALADRPLMVVGVLLVALGVQAVALGLIGEILVFLNAPNRRPYRLAQTKAQATEEHPNSRRPDGGDEQGDPIAATLL